MVDYWPPAGRKAKAAIILACVSVAVVAIFLIGERLFGRIDGHHNQARVAAAQIELLSAALDDYRLDVGDYPTSEQGLRALRERPQNVARWNGPYTRNYTRKEISLDPWGRPYIYRYPGRQPGKPDLMTYGADGRPGGEGENADIIQESWR